MNLSKVVQLPDFSRFEIPEKQRNLYMRDAVIFEGILNENRSMADQNEPAEKGNYVLAEITGQNGSSRTLHLELGKKHYQELADALLGCRANDDIQAVMYGEQVNVHIVSVRKTVEFDVTDESVAGLGIPGVGSKTDYRRKYILENGENYAMRVFDAIYERLFEQMIGYSEIEFDGEDVEHFHENQKTMLNVVSGNAQERILLGYGQNGKYSLEECEKMYYEDNKETYRVYLLGKALAEKNGVHPSEEDRAEAYEYYTMIYGKNAEQIEAEGLSDEALFSFYFQYASLALLDYYKSIVTFNAEGISAMTING